MGTYVCRACPCTLQVFQWMYVAHARPMLKFMPMHLAMVTIMIYFGPNYFFGSSAQGSSVCPCPSPLTAPPWCLDGLDSGGMGFRQPVLRSQRKFSGRRKGACVRVWGVRVCACAHVHVCARARACMYVCARVCVFVYVRGRERGRRSFRSQNLGGSTLTTMS